MRRIAIIAAVAGYHATRRRVFAQQSRGNGPLGPNRPGVAPVCPRANNECLGIPTDVVSGARRPVCHPAAQNWGGGHRWPTTAFSTRRSGAVPCTTGRQGKPTATDHLHRDFRGRTGEEAAKSFFGCRAGISSVSGGLVGSCPAPRGPDHFSAARGEIDRPRRITPRRIAFPVRHR